MAWLPPGGGVRQRHGFDTAGPSATHEQRAYVFGLHYSLQYTLAHCSYIPGVQVRRVHSPDVRAAAVWVPRVLHEHARTGRCGGTRAYVHGGSILTSIYLEANQAFGSYGFVGPQVD